MEKKSGFFLLGKMNDKIFYCLIFLYQLFFIFQGLDFNDEGFHLTFYQQIFNNPQSVQYNFMYWFSGIMGGSWVYLFPKSGMLGVRLLGILVQTTTIILSYRLLKKYLDAAYVKFGLLIALLILADDPKDFNYDNLSAFFYVSAACLLFQGMKGNRSFKLFFSGVLVSLNFFSRLPNVVGLGLLLVIIYYAVLHHQAVGSTIKKIIFFIAGFGIATVCLLLFMKSINHYQLFADNIKMVIQMGKSGENSHGLVKMMQSYINENVASVKVIVLLVIAVVVGATVFSALKKVINIRYLAWITRCAIILLLVLLAISGRLMNFEVYFRLFTCMRGLAFFSVMMILLYDYDKDIKVLALLSCLVLLLQPMGSDTLYSSGRYSFWLALPVTFAYFFNLQSVVINSSVKKFVEIKTMLETSSVFGISEKQFVIMRNWGGIFLTLYFFCYSILFTWGDNRDRTKMVYSVNNKLAAGIFTTKKRADAVDELLIESSKYIKKGDDVLAYDVIPMYHFLTETKPFMNNSWPWLYDRGIFKSELYRCLAQKQKLPVVVFQKVNTLNSHNWPNPADDNKDWDISQPRNAAIKEFLANNKYDKVWENTAFSIYVPR